MSVAPVLLALQDADWAPIEDILTDYDPPMPGARVAVLWEDEESGAIGYVSKLPAGWNDETLHYHQVQEEVLVLEGELTLFGVTYQAPAYYLHPALSVHGKAYTATGCTLVSRFAGPVEQTVVDPATEQGD